MPALLATRVPGAPIRPIDPGRRSLLIAVGVAGAAVAVAQVYFLLLSSLSILEQYAAFVALQVVFLGLLLVGLRLDGKRLRDAGFEIRGPIGPAIGFAALLVLVAVDIRLDPGFVLGFGRSFPMDPATFGFLLLSAPLIAVAEVGLFFGYVFRTLSRSIGVRPALLASSTAFALVATNLGILPVLGPTAAVQYLFTTTAVDVVLGMALALLCYKSEWNVLGAVTVWAGVTATAELLPVGAAYPSWVVEFVALLVTAVALLILVAVGLREPRLQSRRYLGERIGPRRYRYRLRARSQVQGSGLLVAGAAVGVALISVSYGLPSVLGTAQPLLAIATGSMSPTLERGTLVVVEHASPDQIHVGTILVFDVGCLPAPTVHRVIRIVDSGPNWVYQTKGDANKVQDPCTVPYADVRGIVLAHVPDLGYFILEPLFAASVVALLVVVPWAWKVGHG